MDYHALKRRDLQALCKEHRIPANSANSVLADKLSALLNEKQKPITRQKTSIESTVEGEPAALKRQAKKVRFSPSNDLVEYEPRSAEKQKDVVTQTRARRNSVAKQVDKPVVDNNTSVELFDDSAQIPVKLTRSRAQLSVKDVVVSNNENNQTRSKAKVFEKVTDVDKGTEDNVRKVTRSKAQTLKTGGGVQRVESRQSKRLIVDAIKADESVEETLVSRARVTRSKAQTLMEDGTGLDVKLHVKKKSGKQVETDENIVDPSKEIMDVPVRATRSSRQTLKEDVGNAVTNLQVDKKRTRRQMKATDSPVDKKEPPKRKSSRARGVEAVDEDEGDKVVRGGKVTRAKAPLAMEVRGRASRSKANTVGIQQLEEPSKHASKKNVNRKKSVLQPEKTEVIIHLEEPVNLPVRKNTRRNSVMPKATNMVEAPTVGKKQSKGQSGKLSVIKGLEDKENLSGSGKDASEEGLREASTGSLKSRKRRGTPIIDDQNTEMEYGSLVDKPPNSSTLGDRKSEGKSVAKMQVESSLKKSMSKTNNQSSVENSSKVKSWAVRSGALIRDGSSKKRAKLSGTEQNDLEHNDVISSKEATPVAKTGNFKLDDDVTRPEVSPSTDKSHRRFTRSAIRSGAVIRNGSPKRRAKLSGTKQNDSEHYDGISSKEATPVAKTGKFQHDDGVTQPEVTPSIDKSHRRFTRSAIRSGAVIRDGSFKRRAKLSGTKQNDSEHYDVISSKVATPIAKTGKFKHDDGVTHPEVTPSIDKSHRRSIRSERKEPGQSAIKEQPVAGTQFSLAKVAKFKHDPAVNTAPGRITRRGIKHAGNAAGSFSEKVDKKKQTGQHSAHKKQSLDDAQMASPEVLELVPNLEVVAEGVSTETELPFDEAQIFSPEVAEVGPNPDVDTIGVRSEYREPYVDVQMSSPEVAEVFANPDRGTVEDGSATPSEVMGQMLGDLSASESVRLPTKVVESRDPVSGTAVDMDSASLVSGESASEEVMEDAGARTEKLTYVASATPCLTENVLSGKPQKPLDLQNFDDGTPSGNFSPIRMTSISMADVAETVCDAVPDGSHEQNLKELYVVSRIYSEDINLETSVLESGRPDANEKETKCTELGSSSKGLQTDVKIEEPLVSVVKTVVMEESCDIHISSLGISTKGNKVDDGNCDSISYNVGSPAVCLPSIQQSDIADDGEQYDKDESANSQNPLMSEPVFEDRSVADEVEAQETDSLAGDYDDVPNADNTLDELTVNNKLQGLDMEDADDTGKQPAKELEFEVVSSTHNNIHDIPILGKLDGEDGSFDVAKESETYSMPSHACNMIQDSLLSGNDCEDEGDTTDKELESNPKPLPDIDAYDACPMGKDVFSIRRQLEPILEPSSAADITVLPFSGNDVNGECDNATMSDQKSHLHMFGSSGIDKGYVPDDVNNVPKELETGSELSNANNLDDNDIEQDGESVHDQLTSSDNLAIHEEDVGGDDLDPPQIKSISVAAEVSDRSCDQEPEPMLNDAVNDVLCDMVGQSDSVIDKDSQKIPGNAQDGESVHDQLTSSDNLAIHEEDVGGDDLDPPQIKSISVAAEVVDRSCDQEPEQMLNDAVDDVLCDTVGQSDSLIDKDSPKIPAISGNDALEESVLDINKDVVTSILGDIYDIDADDDRGNEKGLTESDEGIQPKERLTEFDEGFQPKEIRDVSLITRESLPITYEKEEAPVDDTDSDFPTFKEDDKIKQDDIDADNDRGSEKGLTESDEGVQPNERLTEFHEGFQPKEIRDVSLITRENLPITYEKEEAPVDDTDSDFPTIKEDDKIKQEETQNAGTSVDWRDYGLGMDEFENPVSADGVGKGKKDDQDSDIQASTRTSSSIEESSGLEAGLSNSVRNFEENSQNLADRKSNQEVDMLKESAKTADVTQEVFNRSDSSLKPSFSTPVATQVSCVKDRQDTYSSLKTLFATPAATQVSCVKDSQEDAVNHANQDTYSSRKLFDTTPAVPQISHVKAGHEDAASFANQDPYSSLKSLFTTSASSRASHVNDSKADVDNITFPAGRSNEDGGATGTAGHEFNYQWVDDHSKDLDVTNFEDYPLELFGEEEVDGSFERSGRNKHFECKGEQVDEVKQFEFLTEAAGTSHHDPSCLKDNPIRSGEFGKKEETLMKEVRIGRFGFEPNSNL